MPSGASLKMARVAQFFLVKRMITGIGDSSPATYSQILNGRDPEVVRLNFSTELLELSGSFSEGRTADEGSMKRPRKVVNFAIPFNSEAKMLVPLPELK